MYTMGKLLFKKNNPLFTSLDDIIPIYYLNDFYPFYFKILITVTLKKVFQIYNFWRVFSLFHVGYDTT